MASAKCLCLDPDVRGLLWSLHGGGGLAPDGETPPLCWPPTEHPCSQSVLRGCGELELGAGSGRSQICLGGGGTHGSRDARGILGRRGAGGAHGPAGSELLQTCWGLLRDEKLIKLAGWDHRWGSDPGPPLSCPAECEGRWAARLEAEALQETCLLQLLPHHAAGGPQAGPLLLL